MKKNYRVVGLMSGTSLDGLDIACCDFKYTAGKWLFKILEGETVPYSTTLLRQLMNAGSSSATELVSLHASYGLWTGRTVAAFLRRHSLHPDLISAHGHTVFHQPEKGFTFQIGSGAAIAAVSGVPTACDFRSSDVAKGGQGAPLVPIGDELLFPTYSHCLNLGGFANISYRKQGKRLAFDICPVNIVLNELSRRLGLPFDEGGALASKGKLNSSLLHKLGAAAFYKQQGPKSLGSEWVQQAVIPLLNKSRLPVEDLLHTYVIHVSEKIAALLDKRVATVLVSGGGAYNHFLMEMIHERTKAKIVIPDDSLIQFREALIFAFLGVLRLTEQVNCLSSVTGSVSDTIGGCIYAGKPGRK